MRRTPNWQQYHCHTDFANNHQPWTEQATRQYGTLHDAEHDFNQLLHRALQQLDQHTTTKEPSE